MPDHYKWDIIVKGTGFPAVWDININKLAMINHTFPVCFDTFIQEPIENACDTSSLNSTADFPQL